MPTKIFIQKFCGSTLEILDLIESEITILDSEPQEKSKVIELVISQIQSIKLKSLPMKFTELILLVDSIQLTLVAMQDDRVVMSHNSKDVLNNSLKCLRDMVVARRDGGEYSDENISFIRIQLAELLVA